MKCNKRCCCCRRGRRLWHKLFPRVEIAVPQAHNADDLVSVLQALHTCLLRESSMWTNVRTVFDTLHTCVLGESSMWTNVHTASGFVDLSRLLCLPELTVRPPSSQKRLLRVFSHVCCGLSDVVQTKLLSWRCPGHQSVDCWMMLVSYWCAVTQWLTQPRWQLSSMWIWIWCSYRTWWVLVCTQVNWTTSVCLACVGDHVWHENDRGSFTDKA